KVMALQMLRGYKSLCLSPMNLLVTRGKNRCNENTIVTTKTTCRSCSLNSDIQCPEGYTKITNGSGIRDCRYYIEIRKFTLSLPGCRHKCLKEFQQPQCCLGYWGPDCLGKSTSLHQHPFLHGLETCKLPIQLVPGSVPSICKEA
uniref:Stabilin 2 n=1 Tax=Varanus komodoensis TaxID=61221 RepID=A0A8D2LBQ4_VARKO